MGMTIDEIIQGIQVIKAQAEWDYPLEWQIVLDGAIETMRKYQQIAEISEPLKKLSFDEMSDIERKILEAVENGEDNRVDDAG